MTNKQYEKLLDQADKNGLFEDLVCPKCENTNSINYKDTKKNSSGVWYYCNKCEWLDVIGWDIIEEVAKNNK